MPSKDRVSDAYFRQAETAAKNFSSDRIRENFGTLVTGLEAPSYLPLTHTVTPAGELVVHPNEPISFSLIGGGSISFGRIEETKYGRVQQSTVFTLNIPNTHGQLVSHPSAVLSSLLGEVTGVTARIYPAEAKEMIRAMALLKPGQDILLENFDWHDTPRMQVLNQLKVSATQIPWTETAKNQTSPAVAKIMDSSSLEELASSFPQEELVAVFGAQDTALKLVRYLASCDPPTPTFRSLDSFFASVYAYVENMEEIFGPASANKQLENPEVYQRVMDFINFGHRHDLLQVLEDPKLKVAFNPHITQKFAELPDDPRFPL